jgi:hypothetical protein
MTNLQMQATRSTETSVGIYQSTMRHIPDDFNITCGCFEHWKFVFTAGHSEVSQPLVSFILWAEHTPEHTREHTPEKRFAVSSQRKN